MQAVAKQTSEDLRKAREELFRELDKGIRDLERGDVIPHEDFMKEMRALPKQPIQQNKGQQQPRE